MWRRLFLFSLSLFRVQFPPWMSSRFLWINMNSSPPNIVLTPENGVRTGRPHRPRPFRKPGFSHFFFQKRPLSPPHRRMEQAPVPRHSAGAAGRKTLRTPGREKVEPPGSGSAFLVIFSCLLGPPLCIQRQRPRPAAAGTQMTISPSASILQGLMQSRYPECSPLFVVRRISLRRKLLANPERSFRRVRSVPLYSTHSVQGPGYQTCPSM